MLASLRLASALFLLGSLQVAFAIDPPAYETNPDFQKHWEKAEEYTKAHRLNDAISEYKSANKKAEGHCIKCLSRMCNMQMRTGDYKAAAESAQLIQNAVVTPQAKAQAGYARGVALFHLGAEHHKDETLREADRELKAAYAGDPTLHTPLFVDGQVLALLKQDEEAKGAFSKFIAVSGASADETEFVTRARRFGADPDLARQKMAPAFSIVTADGRSLTLDDFAGKVVLLDFWATWCGPCKMELPRVRDISRKFAGQPLVVLSISWDKDAAKWRDYITKNEMTWPQYDDADGRLSQLFGVTAIPHYFTIDTNGILKAEEIGTDAPIEGKLKKLIAQANQALVKTASAPTAP